MTIISLESKQEEVFSWLLSSRIESAVKHNDADEIEILRMVWDNESWESIVKKFETEGSVWYCWWIDGVHKYTRMMLGGLSCEK